jgi:hypothetical protein
VSDIKSNIIRSNFIESANTDVSSIIIGSTSTGFENFSDSSIVEKNQLIGSSESGAGHSIFIYDQKYVKVRYNYVAYADFGVVFKARDNSMIGTDMYYNVFVDCRNYAGLRGCDSTKVYNNTGVNFDRKPEGFLLFAHEDFPSNPIEGNEIKNNIFASFHAYGVSILNDINDLNITNTDIDYNVWYNPADTFALSNSVVYDYAAYKSTFSQDANSFNTNPNFKSSSELWPIQPSDAISNGLDLGVTYQNGLDISSSWPDNVITTPQLSEWSIGAYVVPLGKRFIESNLKVIYDKNSKKFIYFDN